MPVSQLSQDEREQLLKLARNAIVNRLLGNKISKLDKLELSPNLCERGATFVTLTIDGQLRGCIGTLEPTKALVDDVVEHAVAAAFQDYRFPPVIVEELDAIKIEISRLTSPCALVFDNPEDLLAKLRPGVDGVILKYGPLRATFLPQVWEKISDPSEFLDHLCAKMGAPVDLWRRQKLEVFVYQVEEFHE